jgi:diguanylate cyclase (GGDEF)-like protein
LIVGDLDHFKSVNDRFGHPAGDEVLRRVAAQLQNVSRRSDVALRLGGEEFALLVPETDCRGAVALANRVGDAVRQEFIGEPVGVTMSFGVACYPEDGEKPDALFEAADTALMAAKAHGRDRAVVYGGGASPRACREVPEAEVRPR